MHSMQTPSFSDKTPSIVLLDSGVGGLTTLSLLMGALPRLQFIYVADTLRHPLGTKSAASLADVWRSWRNLQSQLDFEVLHTVIACNTMSVWAYATGKTLQETTTLVQGFQYLLETHPTPLGKVFLAATEFTTKSMVYRDLLAARGAKVVTAAPLTRSERIVNRGSLNDPDSTAIIQQEIRSHAEPGMAYNSVILGCTCFALLSQEVFAPILADQGQFLDPSRGVARIVDARVDLRNYDYLSVATGVSSTNTVNASAAVAVFCTGDFESFWLQAQQVLPLLPNLQCFHGRVHGH